jgi:thymidylate synthase
LWQETDLHETPGLAPCAFLTIWNVRGEYLDMCLIQRSGDMLTASGAGGINEIQYAALLMMIARHTGYKPGVFTHFVANEQIYDRHTEQAKEMISRAVDVMTCKIPRLILNPEKTNFYDMTIDDFTMENYTPVEPQLSLELGI